MTVPLGPGTEAPLSSCVFPVCCLSCMERLARNNRAQGLAQPTSPQPAVGASALLPVCVPSPVCRWLAVSVLILSAKALGCIQLGCALPEPAGDPGDCGHGFDPP